MKWWVVREMKIIDVVGFLVSEFRNQCGVVQRSLRRRVLRDEEHYSWVKSRICPNNLAAISEAGYLIPSSKEFHYKH